MNEPAKDWEQLHGQTKEPESEPAKFTGYTRDNLLDVKRDRGFPGLKDIGKTFGVTSSGSDRLIEKILLAQDKREAEAAISVARQAVEASEFECTNINDLYHKPVNLEQGVLADEAHARFPALVDQREGEMIIEALEKFGIRHGFTFEFVLKFQAFRCIKDGKHVDWVQLNELCKMYKLPINPTVLVLSKRLYTAPAERAWRPE